LTAIKADPRSEQVIDQLQVQCQLCLRFNDARIAMSRLAPLLSAALLISTLGPALGLTEKEIERALNRLYTQGYEHDWDGSESVHAAILAYQRDWRLPEDGMLDEELLARLEGEHPDTVSREQWTEDARCVFHNKLPTPRVTVSFDGNCKNGHAYGEGTETWRFMLKGKWVVSTGSGTFVDGELSGYGTYRWASGQVYEGEFVHGARTGYGISRFPNGEIYEGYFVDGERNGHGIYRWISGQVYEGEYVNDAQSGHGIYRWASGNVYEGDFVDDARTGHGIYRWASGNVYEGDFVDGARTGHGIYRWANGDVYEGDFVDGARTGYGLFRMADGTVIEGNWIDGVLQD
jgi:hypothetical protein